MAIVNTICNIKKEDFKGGKFYEIGNKLDVERNDNKLMYEYANETVKTVLGAEVEAVIPHPTLDEKIKNDPKWGLLNPCNCFDKGKMVPYNIVEDAEGFPQWK